MKLTFPGLLLAFLAACSSTTAPAPPQKPAETPIETLSDQRAISEDLALGYELLGRYYMRSDFAKIAEQSEMLLEVNPNDPILTYSIAVNYARIGNKAKAIEWLEKLAALRSDLIPRDDEFAQIESPEYRTAKALVVAAAPEFKPARVKFRLADRELIPEGIAYDPVDRTFYVGSLHSRKVVSVDANGTVSDFSSAGDGLFSVVGLRVDPGRRLLWVATSASEGFDINNTGRASLRKYDLKERKLLQTYSLGNNPRHYLNDIALGWDGEVYVTDSTSGAIYVTRGNGLVEVVKQGTFRYPNGIVASPIKGTLIIADFARGLSLINVVGGKPKRLLHAPGVNFHGIDGLYSVDGDLIAVQNGAGLGRIIRMKLNRSSDTVTSFEVLHANDPLFDVPTTAAIDGQSIFVIANSQLGRIAPDGRLLSPETLQETAVIELSLARRGR